MIYLAMALLLLWIIWQRPSSPQFAGVSVDYLDSKPKQDKPWQRLLMFKKDSAPAPEPDPAIGEAAKMNAQLGQDWLDFAKDSFAQSQERQKKTDATAKEIAEQQMGIAERKTEWSKQDRQRYKDLFQPLEEEFVDKATEFGTPEKQAEAAAEARATVLGAADQRQEARSNRMAAMGIDPRSGRYQGIQRAADTNTALATADAENRARVRIRQKGLGMLADAANFGRGLPAQSASAARIGIGAGSAAMGTNAAANAQFRSNIGIMGQGFSGAMGGYSSQANMLNGQYQNQLSGWKAGQQASASNTASIASGVGTAIGLGMMMF